MPLFEITSGNIGEILDFSGEVFSDLKPLFYLLVGLILGNLVLNYILDIVRERFEERREAKRIEQN
jgi:hypothetical protein